MHCSRQARWPSGNTRLARKRRWRRDQRLTRNGNGRDGAGWPVRRISSFRGRRIIAVAESDGQTHAPAQQNKSCHKNGSKQSLRLFRHTALGRGGPLGLRRCTDVMIDWLIHQLKLLCTSERRMPERCQLDICNLHFHLVDTDQTIAPCKQATPCLNRPGKETFRLQMFTSRESEPELSISSPNQRTFLFCFLMDALGESKGILWEFKDKDWHTGTASLAEIYSNGDFENVKHSTLPSTLPSNEFWIWNRFLCRQKMRQRQVGLRIKTTLALTSGRGQHYCVKSHPTTFLFSYPATGQMVALNCRTFLNMINEILIPRQKTIETGQKKNR